MAFIGMALAKASGALVSALNGIETWRHSEMKMVIESQWRNIG